MLEDLLLDRLVQSSGELEKRAHLIDLRPEHLIDQVCPQDFLPPER